MAPHLVRDASVIHLLDKQQKKKGSGEIKAHVDILSLNCLLEVQWAGAYIRLSLRRTIRFSIYRFRCSFA